MKRTKLRALLKFCMKGVFLICRWSTKIVGINDNRCKDLYTNEIFSSAAVCAGLPASCAAPQPDRERIGTGIHDASLAKKKFVCRWGGTIYLSDYGC